VTASAPLQDKVAIVTGAGRGLGRGIALALGDAGARVVASGRDGASVTETAALISAAGGTSSAELCDVTDQDQIDRLVSGTVARFGTVDILVNNAMGPHGHGMLVDVTAETFLAAFTSSALASFRMMKACYPHLRGDGVVINVGTGASLRPDPAGYAIYAAVKEAIRALSRVAACEWGRDGIRVHTIVPLAGSPTLDAWAADRPEEAARFFSSIPLGRVGDAEHDIGRVVVFLSGSDSAYMTGNSILVDGGQAFLR
jgi:NAD(P)-dependent dehydrogenase (short-subunit alcohol dehydrogenase family)